VREPAGAPRLPQPRRPEVTLALSEVPATAPPSRRLGDLLVNPGGPGAPGRSLAAFVAAGLDPAVAARYTIVGFDTRGTGASVPALHCDPSFFAGARPDYIPASRAAEQVLIGRARTYAGDCQQQYGWLLPYMTSADLARDMNSIRLALRQQKISYFGYSYGTYLGQVCATLFPAHLRRMVLDRTVDPTGAWYADNIAQDYAFEARLKAFLAWAARYNGTYPLGSTEARVQAAWYTARKRLTARPAAGPSGPVVGPDEFDGTFSAGAYNDDYWPGQAAHWPTTCTAAPPGRWSASTRPRGARARTSSPSTTPCSAVMSPGRGTGPGGMPTPGRCTPARPSRRGITPGSTPPARSGRCTVPRGRCRSRGPGCPAS
jgi:pimeloyl-ACP methyl ester carboxylesterase